MDFFTRKWKDYVYENYEKFLIEYKAKYYIIEISYGKQTFEYNEQLLKDKFDLYYETKKKYVDSYDYLEKEFGLYEKVELLTYEDEFENFKNRVEIYSERLKEEASQNVRKEHEGNITLEDVEKIDFRLIALNLHNADHYAITDLITLTNEVMGFLTGMTKFAKDSNKLEYEKLEDSYIWFHDSLVLDIGKTKEYSYVVVLDNSIYYRITMANGDANYDIDFIFRKQLYDVETYEYGYCYDKGYYLRLQDLEIWGDNITINQI